MEELSDLIATKFVPAFISGKLLCRNRLLAQIAENPAARLVFIHGVAGSGKSSFLYDYVRLQDIQVAWYSIHETDKDLKVFLTYLLSSLNMHFNLIAHDAISLLNSTANAEQEWKRVITILINGMLKYKKEIYLVLDDYHLLGDTFPIPNLMEFLLLNAPSNFHCFISSRTMSQLPLSYLQSKNALIMFRPKDLLLDLKEIKELFQDIWTYPVSDSLLGLIYSKTGGWFAVARLVFQAIKDKALKEAEQFLLSLNLNENLVYDYLAREVYYKQPEKIRAFLRQTSILSSFNLEIAEFVTKISDTQKLLLEIEKMDLFVIHLDSTGEWFRYHHLFADFLHSLLLKEGGKILTIELHKRAAKWHENHSSISYSNIKEAIHHYYHASEFDDVIRLLKQYGQFFFQEGLLSLLLQWLDGIPQKLLVISHELCLLKGEIYDIIGNWEKAISSYKNAWSLLKKHNMIDKTSIVLEKLILCYIKYGEFSKIFNYCHQALEVCRPEEKGLRSRLLSWLGMAHVVYGGKEWIKGYDLIKEGYNLAYEAGEPGSIAAACISYGFMYHFPQGNFLEAQRVFNEGAEFFNRLGLPFLVCHQTMNKAVVQIFNGQLAEGGETIKQVEKLAHDFNIHFVKQAIKSTLLFSAMDNKDMEKAKSLSQDLMEYEIPLQLKPWYYRSVVLLHLMEGNTEQAMVTVQEMLAQLKLVGNGMYSPECYLVIGFAFWKQHIQHKAIKWFKEALLTAMCGKMKFWIMKAHYCLAGAYAIIGNSSYEFKEHYRMALKLSSENNYWHVWSTDIFDYTMPILIEAVKFEVEPEQTKKIMGVLLPKLLQKLESILATGPQKERELACRILGNINSADARLLLKKAQNDPTCKVRKKAQALLSGSPVNAPVLSIKTLGLFTITRDTVFIQPKDWQRLKVSKLFKYFLSIYPKEITCDQLIEIFWKHLRLKEAKHNLAVHINYLRRALNPLGARRDEGFILGNADIFKLVLKEEDYFDIIEFEENCLRFEKFWNEKKEERATLEGKNALNLYNGDFLEGDMYDEWAISRREELRKKYLFLLAKLGRYYEQRNDFHDAIQYYRLYLKTEPAEETIFQSLFMCFASVGDKLSIKEEYAKYKKNLQKLTWKPSATTLALVKQILK